MFMFSVFLFQIFISSLLLVAQGADHYPYHGVTVGIHPYSHPVLSQYHAQDIYGQYAYGYATPTATKSESKTADGVTRGGYSYIDSNGHLQTVQYTADPIHGFRVAATNLPVDLPEVAYGKAKHLADYEAIKAEHAAIGAERAASVHFSNPVVVPYHSVHQVALLPAPVQELPEVLKARAEHFAAVEATKARDAQIAAEHTALAAYNTANLSPIPHDFTGHVVPVSVPVLTPTPVVGYATKAIYNPYVPAIYGHIGSQYHSQDNLGQYTYGYTGPLSSKTETRTSDGVTRGGYSYIDGNGIVQSVHYIADAAHGFRVAATNLPVGPSNHVGSVPVEASSAPIAHVASIQAPVKVVAKNTGLYAHDVVY